MAFSPALAQLIEAFRVLPGVGAKTAQRMAFYLLQNNKQGGYQLAHALQDTLDRVGRCSRCRMLTENELCDICANSQRDPAVVCVVESPADVVAIEQNANFTGQYFVLMGHLSPIDGIGPEELGLGLLKQRLSGPISELILATSATVEGEATARYLADMAHQVAVKVSRIAHGVPVGGELEYVDSGTLNQAFSGRQTLNID